MRLLWLWWKQEDINHRLDADNSYMLACGEESLKPRFDSVDGWTAEPSTQCEKCERLWLMQQLAD